MVLSNAERQKRHRERVKGKLATLADLTALEYSKQAQGNPKDVIATLADSGHGDDDNGGDDVLKELLVGRFIAAGSEMLARHLEAVSKIYEAANREFLRTYAEPRFLHGDAPPARKPLTVLDMVDIMQEAGQRAALKILEPMANDYLPLVVEAAPVESSPPRRRRRNVASG
jgi:hypothetical protein